MFRKQAACKRLASTYVLQTKLGKLLVQVMTLFNILHTHSLVPDGFGQGIVILLIKNPDMDRTDSGNYTGVSDLVR